MADTVDDEASVSGLEDDQEHRDNPRRRKPYSKDEGPACQSCRKKKAKCSRKQPCSQCLRFKLDCVYDETKNKPGIRMGAIENLNQRVVSLENMFLGQGMLWQQVWNCLSAISHPSASDSGCSPGDRSNRTLEAATAQLKHTLSALGTVTTPDDEDPTPARSAKRQRTAEPYPDNNKPVASAGFLPARGSDPDLPPDDLVDALVEIYFTNIHPWIPMLHVRHFRRRMAIPSQRRQLDTIFHAIVSLCARFSCDPRLGTHEARLALARRSRQVVILQSMESFSVENLQALIICAFDTIGCGRGPSTWSIVGSMTRTVEQLQLSVEDEDRPRSDRGAKALIKRMAFLAPCRDWSELEERRRVFWNVFLMDRFCSIATGWNLSLTSADVKRRLPCEGALWEEGEPLETPTPYFGVSDQSNGACNALPSARPENEDQASLGGFAYCIEATESLSLVSSFFMNQPVDVMNTHDVQMWLMRFKQLDLRLVQWKIFLPERWREACALNAEGIMDPNLTLAHITHNTAVVLLHQGIAYLSAEWQATPIRLPSASSAETCLAAATEVAIIAEKFLQGTVLLTNPQFAFCLFMCGRTLLAHSSYYNVHLPAEFGMLIASLQEISRRWNGFDGSGSVNPGENLASKFATRLIQARQQGPNSLDIRQAAYSEEQPGGGSLLQDPLGGQGESITVHTDNLRALSRSNISLGPGSAMHTDQSMMLNQEGSPDSISLAFPPLPLAFQAPSNSALNTAMGSPVANQMNGLYGMPDHYNHGHAGTGYEDLSAFLEYPFLPDQRVSMFSGPGDKGPPMQE